MLIRRLFIYSKNYLNNDEGQILDKELIDGWEIKIERDQEEHKDEYDNAVINKSSSYLTIW